jgi:hypothetical protein
MKSNKILTSIVMVTLFLILGLWLSDFLSKEYYLSKNDREDSFYLSNVRTRDFQDVISITESQIITTS